MQDTMTQIEILKKNIQEAEAIIVGGASGMSAAAGFRFYYMSDATFKQIAGQLGEKYHADGFFPLLYHLQIKKGNYGQHCSVCTNTCMSVILVSHTGTYEKWVKYFLQQLN